jgi:hypothetical protein
VALVVIGHDEWMVEDVRSSPNEVIVELIERGVRCECERPGCTCTNDADLVCSDGACVCACCLVDCPDVHEDAGLAEGDGGALV